jgi:hypothetical protein
MPDYRVYAVDDDGHFTGGQPLVCANDDDAIAKARFLLTKFLAQGHGVELRSGPKLVISMPSSPPEPSPTR